GRAVLRKNGPSGCNYGYAPARAGQSGIAKCPGRAIRCPVFGVSHASQSRSGPTSEPPPGPPEGKPCSSPHPPPPPPPPRSRVPRGAAGGAGGAKRRGERALQPGACPQWGSTKGEETCWEASAQVEGFFTPLVGLGALLGLLSGKPAPIYHAGPSRYSHRCS